MERGHREREENELKSYFYVTLGKDEALKSVYARISLIVQWFRRLTPHAGAQVRSLVSGAKIPHATQPNK